MGTIEEHKFVTTNPLVVSPRPSDLAAEPAVGIFWHIGDALVIDRSSLDEAEPYGDCITHAAGHYERWEEWQALGSSRLVSTGYPALIGSSEYDEWPRGRVVYETLAKRFVLYADRRLQKPGIIKALKGAFGLDDCNVVVMSDQHYR
jgi:hypothetical protein